MKAELTLSLQTSASNEGRLKTISRIQMMVIPNLNKQNNIMVMLENMSQYEILL